MIRHLAPLPADHSLAQLRNAARTRFPSLIDCNTVDVDGTPNLAVYLPDGSSADPAAWQASVAAHVPVHPTPEEQAATAAGNHATIEQAITDALATLDTLIAANSIPQIPAGSRTLSQLTADVRAQRDANQATRAGAQDVARTLKRLIRLVRGDFSGTD